MKHCIALMSALLLCFAAVPVYAEEPSSAYTVLSDSEQLLFSEEAILDSVGGYVENFKTIATVALGAFLIVTALYLLFNLIRYLFR